MIEPVEQKKFPLGKWVNSKGNIICVRQMSSWHVINSLSILEKRHRAGVLIHGKETTEELCYGEPLIERIVVFRQEIRRRTEALGK